MRPGLRCSSIFFALLLAAFAMASSAMAQEGPLDSSQPTGITVDEIVRRFSSKEKEFKQARDQYTYRQSVKVTTPEDDGQYQQVFDVTFDDQGHKTKNVVFAPQSTLEKLSMSEEDLDDIENRLPFVLTSDEIGEYTILYVGLQQEDELHCYVFDIAPKEIVGKKRYFQGRIWVDDHDFQIVKTYGKTVPDLGVGKKRKGNENLFPKFTTWRQQIDNQYWFPTFTRADDTLHFSTGDIQIREVIKYTDYKKFGANVKITYDGKDVQKDAQPPADGKQPPASSTPPAPPPPPQK